MALRLFLAGRWGSDPDPNDDDTLFLVRAPDHLVAADLVLPALKFLPHAYVELAVHYLYDLGADASGTKDATIVCGPFSAGWRNARIHYLCWQHEHFWSADRQHWRWEAHPFVEDGIAEAFYTNGQIAARFVYRAGERCGLCEQWYPNGQLMARGSYLSSQIRIGTHEDWYANGMLATRHVFDIVAPNQMSATVTYWDEHGAVVKEHEETWHTGLGREENQADS